MELQQFLEKNRQLIDRALQELLPAPGSLPTLIPQAMAHAVAGGKRLRPFLTLSAAQAFGLHPEAVLPTACGIEMMHCATLVHDDLPCIDDSDLRHGRSSCHTAFGEATAVLAADGLIIMSFECLARQTEFPDTPPERVVRCVREFSEHTGPRGLIVGEALDIETERRQYNEEELEFIHHNKTAKLIMFAARAGAMLAGASEDDLQRLTDYAQALGLLFQVTDDLLDVEGDEAVVGKPVGADADSGKATYPGLLGAESSRRRAAEIAKRATDAAQELPGAATWLALAEFIVHRRK